MVKFPAYKVKLFPELLAHRFIQFLDDLHERGLCLHEVIVLVFKKFIPLGQNFIVLDRVDIDISESLYLAL